MHITRRTWPSLAAVILVAALTLLIAAQDSRAARLTGTSTAAQGGPRHTGSIPGDSPAGPLHAAWSVTGQDVIGTPVIAEDLVIAAVLPTGSGAMRIDAYDRLSGAVRWSRTTNLSNGSDLTYDRGLVYLVSRNAIMQALDARTGDVVWTTQLSGQPFTDAGPTAADGVVYVGGAGGGGTVWALDGQTGQLLWSSNVNPGADWSQLAVDDDHVYVTGGCAETVALDRDTGDVDWHYVRDCTGGGGAAAVVDGDNVEVRDWNTSYRLNASTGAFVSSHAATTFPAFSDGVSMYTTTSTIAAYDSADHQIWSYAAPSNIVLAPVATGKVVYVLLANGQLVALDLHSGAHLGEAPTGLSSAVISAAGEKQGFGIAEGTLTASLAGRMVVYGEPGPDTAIGTAPRYFTTAKDASVPFSSTADGATFACSVDGAAYTPCTSPLALSGLADGRHEVDVRSTASGVTDTSPASREWVIDTTPPDTLLLDGPDAVASLANSYFIFGSSEGDALVRCSIDDAAWFECGNGFFPTALTDGVHTIRATAYDRAGNVDATPFTQTWTVDGTPPHATVSAPSSSTATATASFSANEASTFFCALDDEDFAECTSPWTRSGLTTGEHTLYVVAVDAAGNFEDVPAETSWLVLPDSDKDGRPDTSDNCPSVANADQADLDHDGHGDACDSDDDGDLISDLADRCKTVAGNGPDGCPLVTDPAANLPGMKSLALSAASTIEGQTKRLSRGLKLIVMVPELPAAGRVRLIVHIGGKKAVDETISVPAHQTLPINFRITSGKTRKLFTRKLIKGDITATVTLASGRSVSAKRKFTIRRSQPQPGTSGR